MDTISQDINVTKKGNSLKFVNNDTNCFLIFNTRDSMEYELINFSCGTRGGSNGAKLLYYALNYITNPENIPRREQPFRIALLAVPSSEDNSETIESKYKLIDYYKKLGFNLDINAVRIGMNDRMFALVDTLKGTLKNYLKLQSAGKLKRKHIKTNVKKHKKSLRKNTRKNTRKRKTN